VCRSLPRSLRLQVLVDHKSSVVQFFLVPSHAGFELRAQQGHNRQSGRGGSGSTETQGWQAARAYFSRIFAWKCDRSATSCSRFRKAAASFAAEAALSHRQDGDRRHERPQPITGKSHHSTLAREPRYESCLSEQLSRKRILSPAFGDVKTLFRPPRAENPFEFLTNFMYSKTLLCDRREWKRGLPRMAHESPHLDKGPRLIAQCSGRPCAGREWRPSLPRATRARTKPLIAQCR
jgi:hypothetical protein